MIYHFYKVTFPDLLTVLGVTVTLSQSSTANVWKHIYFSTFCGILMTLKRSATLPKFKAVKTGILKNTVFWDVEQKFIDDSEEHMPPS